MLTYSLISHLSPHIKKAPYKTVQHLCFFIIVPYVQLFVNETVLTNRKIC